MNRLVLPYDLILYFCSRKLYPIGIVGCIIGVNNKHDRRNEEELHCPQSGLDMRSTDACCGILGRSTRTHFYQDG